MKIVIKIDESRIEGRCAFKKPFEQLVSKIDNIANMCAVSLDLHWHLPHTGNFARVKVKSEVKKCDAGESIIIIGANANDISYDYNISHEDLDR